VYEDHPEVWTWKFRFMLVTVLFFLTFIAGPVRACYQGIEEACYSYEMGLVLVLVPLQIVLLVASSHDGGHGPKYNEDHDRTVYNRLTVGVFAISAAIVTLKYNLPSRFGGLFPFVKWIISFNIFFDMGDMAVAPATRATYLPYGSPTLVHVLVPMVIPFLCFGFTYIFLVIMRSLITPVKIEPGKPGKP